MKTDHILFYLKTSFIITKSREVGEVIKEVYKIL